MSKKKYIDLNDRDLVSGKYHKEHHIAYARINRKNTKALKDVYGV